MVTTRSDRRPAKLRTMRTCRLNIPEDAHQGGVITSQTTLCRNLVEKEGEGVFSKGAYGGGGRIFEGGVLAGHYGIRMFW